MPQPQNASEDAIERLKRDIAKDRSRLSFAMQFAEPHDESETSSIGRLYRVFVAMGQAS